MCFISETLEGKSTSVGRGQADLSDDADAHNVVSLFSALQGDESLPQDSLDLAVIMSHGPITCKRQARVPEGSILQLGLSTGQISESSLEGRIQYRECGLDCHSPPSQAEGCPS